MLSTEVSYWPFSSDNVDVAKWWLSYNGSFASLGTSALGSSCSALPSRANLQQARQEE